MNKVKNIYYIKGNGDELDKVIGGRGLATGLILELDDGTWLRQHNDSPLAPWGEMDNPPNQETL